MNAMDKLEDTRAGELGRRSHVKVIASMISVRSRGLVERFVRRPGDKLSGDEADGRRPAPPVASLTE